MDIFTDTRFSPYLNTTTVTKYFPKNTLSESSVKRNPIYKLLKQNQLLDEQEKLEYKQKIQTQQNLRRSSMSLSENKFICNKTIQRVRTMNSFIIDNNHYQSKSNQRIKTNQCDSNSKCSEVIKFNSFSYGVERFQKSLDRQKSKCSILKKYNKIVEYHFDKFQPNQDRSRSEIVQHSNIIRLLLNRQEQKCQTNNINNVSNNQTVNSQQQKLEQQKLQKQKLLKQILTSKHCQEKVQKVINTYLKDLSHSQSNKLIYKKSIKQRKFSQQRLTYPNHKSLNRFDLLSNSNKEKNHNKENILKNNFLKVPSKNVNNFLQNKNQQSKMKKLTLFKPQNNNFIAQNVKLTISAPIMTY